MQSGAATTEPDTDRGEEQTASQSEDQAAQSGEPGEDGARGVITPLINGGSC